MNGIYEVKVKNVKQDRILFGEITNIPDKPMNFCGFPITYRGQVICLNCVFKGKNVMFFYDYDLHCSNCEIEGFVTNHNNSNLCIRCYHESL